MKLEYYKFVLAFDLINLFLCNAFVVYLHNVFVVVINQFLKLQVFPKVCLTRICNNVLGSCRWGEL